MIAAYGLARGGGSGTGCTFTNRRLRIRITQKNRFPAKTTHISGSGTLGAPCDRHWRYGTPPLEVCGLAELGDIKGSRAGFALGGIRLKGVLHPLVEPFAIVCWLADLNVLDGQSNGRVISREGNVDNPPGDVRQKGGRGHGRERDTEVHD